MPVTLAIEHETASILTFQDPYTFEEWLAAVRALLTRGPVVRVLVDRRFATPPTREFVEHMVSFLSTHANELKGSRAAVVTSSDAGFGVARMVELMAQARHVPTEIHAFRSYDDAERWLATQQLDPVE